MRLGAADIGTGARTALTQIAADALGVELDRVGVEIGDSAFPRAPVAGGSKGTASWGWAIREACRALRARLEGEHGGVVPAGGLEATADTAADLRSREAFSRHAFGAHLVDDEAAPGAPPGESVDALQARAESLVREIARGRSPWTGFLVQHVVFLAVANVVLFVVAIALAPYLSLR